VEEGHTREGNCDPFDASGRVESVPDLHRYNGTMAGRECYHCKQWVEAGEPHDCWTTTEAALTKDLSEDLQDAWERLRDVVPLTRVQSPEPLINEEQRDSRWVFCPILCTDNHLWVRSSNEASNVRLNFGKATVVHHRHILTTLYGNVIDNCCNQAIALIDPATGVLSVKGILLQERGVRLPSDTFPLHEHTLGRG